MNKRIILSLAIIFAAFFVKMNFVDAKNLTQNGVTIDTLDPKLVCEDTSVVQNTLRNSNVKMRKVNMYLFTNASGKHIIKTGRFYRQTIGSTEKLGFCVDMEKDHGSKYKVDDKKYEAWIEPAKKFESDNPDYYAIRILTFEDAVKEEYQNLIDCLMENEACPAYYDAKANLANPGYTVERYQHLLNTESEEMIYNMAVIMAQISSWALSEGEPEKIMKKVYYGDTDQLRIAMAQAVCGIYGHPEIASSDIIKSCSYDPNITDWEKQNEDFRYWYNYLLVDENGSYTEYAFVRSVWDNLSNDGCGIFSSKYGCYKNDTYWNYLTAYLNGYKKPTLYIPEESWQQRLLSDYYCEPVEDKPSTGCWELKTNIPNACKISDNSGFVKDIEDWKCIFSVAKSSSAELRNHYEMDQLNSYCNVFCQEKITMKLPDYGTTTSQGSYLTVNLKNNFDNNISPLNYIGTKLCRTTSALEGKINWKQFEKDYADANIVVEKNWNSYQQALANYTACTEQPYQVTSSTSSDGWYSLSSLNRTNHDCKTDLKIVEEQEEACNNRYENDKKATENYYKSVERCYESASKMLNNTAGLSAEALMGIALAYSNKIKSCNSMMNRYYDRVDADYERWDRCLYIADRYCPPNNDSNNTDGYADFYTERRWPQFSKTYGDYVGTSEYFLEEEKKPRITHDTHCNEYYAEMKEAENTYHASLATRESYLSKIRSCTGSKIDAINYDSFDPKVKITYEETVYGTESGWDLKAKTVSKKEHDNFYQTGNALTTSPEEETPGKVEVEVLSKTCDTQFKKCWDDKVTYDRAEWWEKIIEIEKSYNLDNSVYRYVEKGTGQSVHASAKKNNIEYLDMQMGNLPIHYSALPTSNGEGDVFNSSGIPINKDHYNFVIYTKSFGGSSTSPNKFNKYIFEKKTFNGKVYYNKYEDYVCQYKVNCYPMIADNGACPTTPSTGDGLNLVYRTISMYSKTAAFPGQSGSGRKPGDNWDSTSVEKEIVKNRGVNNYEVYMLEPMYEIELTPGLMKKIRRYNEMKNSKRSTIYEGTSKKQTGIIGYSNYDDFDCDSDGMNCKSNFIRGLVQNYSEVKVSGCALKDANC